MYQSAFQVKVWWLVYKIINFLDLKLRAKSHVLQHIRHCRSIDVYSCIDSCAVPIEFEIINGSSWILIWMNNQLYYISFCQCIFQPFGWEFDCNLLAECNSIAEWVQEHVILPVWSYIIIRQWIWLSSDSYSLFRRPRFGYSIYQIIEQ